ncbi:MAG: hypothetical protein WDN49_13600 [Acetobacteraceae bacterium]
MLRSREAAAMTAHARLVLRCSARAGRKAAACTAASTRRRAIPGSSTAC